MMRFRQITMWLAIWPISRCAEAGGLQAESIAEPSRLPRGRTRGDRRAKPDRAGQSQCQTGRNRLTELFARVRREQRPLSLGTIRIPIFNRNQGEIAADASCAHPGAGIAGRCQRHRIVRRRQCLSKRCAAIEEVVELYTSGYLKQAQDSRDISEYAYKRGATSVLEFLDAERSNRADTTGLSPSFGDLYDCARTAQRGSWNEEPAMTMCHRHRTRLMLLSLLGAIALMLAGCSGAGPDNAANHGEQCQHG